MPRAVDRAYVDAVLDALVSRNVVAHVPEIMTYECAYALGKAVDGALRIPLDAAVAFARSIDQLAANVHTSPSSVHERLATGRHYGLTSYDARYVDLAVFLGCALATSDKAMRRACERAGVPLFLAEFA